MDDIIVIERKVDYGYYCQSRRQEKEKEGIFI
jgi:hypothetical protein